MKRILTILCAIAISLLSASAQEKQHSLEITTGYPSIVHNLEYPWAYSTVEMTWNGQTEIYAQIVLNSFMNYLSRQALPTDIQYKVSN